MVILAVLAIYAALILLIWAGFNILFNIAELIVAIVKRQTAQIVIHAIQLFLSMVAVTVVIAFYIYGGK